ncbi:transglutaminase-like domain-containing protein [Bacteriovorax sp. PP10]|uniref:Transglutaminase-like domain-containing protein n=1 Tax=Bacteriovorax antarcticus TaxID=3088717 RepID=A0ABU5VSB0_9BACT|nr:transglutaminase-like domain-containing protein [Bacteriovorax sp. PP10]MEA9355939.1 transglutaminase-like domain-containing protein [Bacteriovorax sp. PP10]
MKNLFFVFILTMSSMALAGVTSPSTVNNSLVEVSGQAKSSTKWIMLNIKKGSYEEEYMVPATAGKFNTTIALQAGSGKYKIKMYQTSNTDRYTTYNSFDSIQVENTDSRDMSFLLPTDVVQSDDPRVVSLVRDVTEAAGTEEEAFQAIYNYIAKTVKYDQVRYKDKSYMTHVYDALSVLENPVAVCSGYANLLAAMSRAYGIRAKVINGKALMSYGWGQHAWNEVYVNDEWKMVDPTWDAGRKYQSYYFMAPERFEKDHHKEMEMRY